MPCPYGGCPRRVKCELNQCLAKGLLAHTSERRYNEPAPLILIWNRHPARAMPVAICRNFGQISGFPNSTPDFIGGVPEQARGVAA